MSITIGGSHLTMQGSTKATIKASITLAGTGTVLPIEVVGEFKDIPQHLHRIYMQSMLASYGSTNVYNNMDDDKEPMTIKEQKREWRLNKIVNLLFKAITK